MSGKLSQTETDRQIRQQVEARAAEEQDKLNAETSEQVRAALEKSHEELNDSRFVLKCATAGPRGCGRIIQKIVGADIGPPRLIYEPTTGAWFLFDDDQHRFVECERNEHLLLVQEVRKVFEAELRRQFQNLKKSDDEGADDNDE